MNESHAARHLNANINRWVHTGIEAPSVLNVQGYTGEVTDRGLAYSAELVHPQLGVIGHVVNDGRGGATKFFPTDPALFNRRDLEQFVAQCRQDGELLAPGSSGVETVLDAAIDEAEYAKAAEEMRLHGTFLVRSYEPRTEDNYGPHRGVAIPCERILLQRRHRSALATALDEDPRFRLPEGALWQMNNGAEWVPMLPEESFSADQFAAKTQALRALPRSTTGPLEVTHALGEVDRLNAFGTAAGIVTLVADTTPAVTTDQWCQCRTRPTRPVRFEEWSLQDGLRGSGTVHGALSCRRLVTID